MCPRKKPPDEAPRRSGFDAPAALESAGIPRRVVECPPKTVLYSQGDPADSVLYIQDGGVQLSVVSGAGKQAIVAMLEGGDFLGEGALAGQTLRMGTATTTCPTTVVVVAKQDMVRVLHEHRDLADRFITHMLARNVRIEADLVDQLFNTSEKRLARTLLLLARYGRQDEPQHVLPKVSQEALAEMVGTTRSRVNFFMNKFRKLGFIEYGEDLRINGSLLSVVLHD